MDSNSETTVSGPNHPEDNFFSPENYAFYAESPYTSLDKSQNSIRLLRLLKDDETGTLRGTLSAGIPLSEADGTYTALSYCAGDPKRTRPIIIDGVKFNAFANLARALEDTQRYREKEHSDQEPLVWADQICINQSDLEERGHQVGFMAQIYKSAREVTVCLSAEPNMTEGEDDEEKNGNGSAIPWINDFLTQFPELVSFVKRASSWKGFVDIIGEKLTRYNVQNTYWGNGGEELGGFGIEPGSEKEVFHALSNPKSDAFVEGWIDAFRMLGQQWWSRAWILQEFVMARNATILWGQQSILWDEFSAVMLCLTGTRRLNTCSAVLGNFKNSKLASQWHSLVIAQTGHSIDHRIRGEKLRRAADFVMKLKWRQTIGGNKYTNLSTLLSHSRSCGATDPRDHVYAFVGLVDPEYGIHPNYSVSNSIQEVFIETARRVILHDQNLHSLSLAMETRGKLSSTLPSWVPDWTAQPLPESFLKPRIELVWDPNQVDAVSFLSDGRTLVVHGYFIGMLNLLVGGNFVFSILAKYEVCVNGAALYDELWLLETANEPLILRKEEEGGGKYRLIGTTLIYEWIQADEYNSFRMPSQQAMIEEAGMKHEIHIC